MHKGIVQKGKGEGRLLGFPTANIYLTDRQEPGIFSAMVYFKDGSFHPAAVYVSPEGGILEAHIFEFDREIYGEEIRVDIIEKIRDSMPYTSDDDMRMQIREDVREIKRRMESYVHRHN